MGMSDLYGTADRAESIATIHAALDAGITLIDTGDFYGSGHNELLIREALAGRRRENVVISVKFGALRDPAGGWVGIDNSPAALKNSLAQSLQRLGTDYIDIYRPARLDPKVPIEDTVGAMAEMVKAGYVRHIGLSEVSAQTVRKAHAVHPIGDLQIEYSLISRGIEKEILPTLRELGVGITAYGVLSRGLISGHWSRIARAEGFSQDQSALPGGEPGSEPATGREAARRGGRAGATVAQLAIAWVLAQGPDIVPLIGARTRDRLAESLKALEIQLGDADLAQIERAIPPGAAAGDRYDTHQMRILDSEKTAK